MKRSLAILVALLLPATAGAQQALPKWHMTGDEACYGFEEARQLLILDSELVMRRESAGLSDSLRISVGHLTAALDTQKAATQVILDDNAYLTAQLKEALARANKAEVSKSPSLGWTVAGALALVVAGAALGYYLK